MMRANPIDENFFSRFARHNWERKPLVVRNIESDLIELNDQAVFDLVVKAADRSRRERKLLGFKFYADGIRSSDVETFYVLPRKSDKNFLGYNERMERIYQDYCLVCDELLQVNGEKQSLLTEFTHRLYRHVGFPNRFAEMGLYLGNYRKTPFGVHRDPCGVFSFPVVGNKTFRAWTPEYVNKNPDLEQSFRYAKHKANSLVLTAGVSDLIYWPSASWHIAESDGSFSATWSLGIWIDRPLSETVSEILIKSLAGQMGQALSSGAVMADNGSDAARSSGEVRSMPKSYLETIETLKGLSRDQLNVSFRKNWMSRLAHGSLKTQAKSDEAFKIGKTLKLRSRKILWTLGEKSKSSKVDFYFAYGESGPHASSSSPLLKLIQALNEGETCTVSRYLEATNRIDLAILKTMGAAGVFS